MEKLTPKVKQIKEKTKRNTVLLQSLRDMLRFSRKKILELLCLAILFL